MALTKLDVVNLLMKNHSKAFSSKEALEVIEVLLEIIKSTLENGEDVMIFGFGKFCLKEKKERRGRNPATASDMMLPARRVVTFKCSGVLRESVNATEKNRQSSM